jgi:N utilization substance protein B
MALDEATAIASLPGLLALSLEEWDPKDQRSGDLRQEAAEYAAQVVAGVCRERARIDEVIDELATDWRVERLATTDRVLLRMAIWELEQAAVPAAAVVNEAVELAKQYGAAESARFINGILAARLAGQQAPGEA